MRWGAKRRKWFMKGNVNRTKKNISVSLDVFIAMPYHMVITLQTYTLLQQKTILQTKKITIHILTQKIRILLP